jgi:hypothetical protein
MSLPQVEFPASMSCSDNCESGESNKEEKQDDEHKPGPGPSFSKAHTAYTTIKFYVTCTAS